MTSERKIRRYTPYFHGWATAFGNHDKHVDAARKLSWLVGDNQIGLILTPQIQALVDLLFATAQDEIEPPRLELGTEALHIADMALRFGEQDQLVLETARRMLERAGDLHLLQTYHLVYASGTRILTLSGQAPLGLVYREIRPLFLRLL